MKLRLHIDDRVLGLVTLVVLGGLLLGDFTGVMRGAFSGGGRTVHAVFADAQQLQTGDFVRIQGVDVGTVTGIASNGGARSATVTMQLDPSAGPLYADAGAQLRWRTVLGASYAVYLTRGTPGAGRLTTGVIPESRTSNQVEVEDLASVDQGAARTGLQTMPGELAQALSNPSAPAGAFSELASISPSLAVALQATRGSSPDADLRTLVSATARTVSALDTPDDEMRTLVAAGAATLQATSQAQGAIRAAIAQSPAALASTRATVVQLDTTLGLADPLIASLERSVPAVGPTLTAVHPTVTGLRSLLQRAVPLLQALKPAAGSLRGAARVGLPLLVALEPSLSRVDDRILPYLAQKDPETGHTTTEMIGGTFTGLGSGAPAQMDADGHFIRFPVSSGSSPVYLPCQTYYGNPDDAGKLAECETLQQALQTVLSTNPLGPPPTSAAK